jgi:hypothetical protein
MIKFDKPINLNGAELRLELKQAGFTIAEPPLIDENGDFWLDVKLTDKVEVAKIVAAHNGTTVAPELTIEDKLASIGLNLTDLKSALGI